MKPRFPAAIGLQVAAELCRILKPACTRLIVAGSLRRRKPEIGDVEILYIPRIDVVPDPADLFASIQQDFAEAAIAGMEGQGILARRKNINGQETYGSKNKLMLHTATGLPVDLFAATEKNWHNYLVCRTGSAENNLRIASQAQRLGYKWNPYRAGYTELSSGRTIPMESEEQVFTFIKLPYLPPEHR
jgi:DNA polymerase/3'-5' exonuclease PolX